MSPIRWPLRVSLPTILLLLSLCGLAAAGISLMGLGQPADAGHWSRYALIAVAVIIVLLLLCGIRVVFAGVVTPLGQAQNKFELLCKGDLTSHIETGSENEMGALLASLKKHQETMARSISGVRNSLAAIGDNAHHIVAGNSDLSGRTDQQAAALQEAAASMEQLASTVKQNADNARQANQLAVTASEVAQRGGQAVGEVVSTMHGISASSQKISDIVGVIDSIAFQTNILALNAAVEAARAGEQGKGFAVVASEVRALAQRSAQAAREIKDLIEDSVRKVAEGSDQVERAGATMEEIVTSVARVTDIMGEISAATVEQSSGIDQINAVVSQIDNVTRQNAQLVEQAAEVGAALRQDVALVTENMSRFRLPAHAVIDVSARAVAAPTPVRRPAKPSSSYAANAPAGQIAAKRPAVKGAASPAAAKPRAPAAPAALPPAAALKRPGPAARSTSSEDDWEEF